MIGDGGILDVEAVVISVLDRVDEKDFLWLSIVGIAALTAVKLTPEWLKHRRLCRKDERDAARQDLRLKMQIQNRRNRSRRKRKGAQE